MQYLYATRVHIWVDMNYWPNLVHLRFWLICQICDTYWWLWLCFQGLHQVCHNIPWKILHIILHKVQRWVSRELGSSLGGEKIIFVMLYTHGMCLQMVIVITHVCCCGPWLGQYSMCISMGSDSHIIRTWEYILRQRCLYLLSRTCKQHTMEYNAFHIITKSRYNRSKCVYTTVREYLVRHRIC